MKETAEVNPVRKQAYTIAAVHCDEPVLMSVESDWEIQLWLRPLGPGRDASRPDSFELPDDLSALICMEVRGCETWAAVCE